MRLVYNEPECYLASYVYAILYAAYNLTAGWLTRTFEPQPNV